MMWVIVANTNICYIFDYDKKNAELTLIKELSQPENRLKTSEVFTSDKPGHYQSDLAGRGAYSPRTDPKQAEIDHFAKKIADELNKGRNENLYEKLIIIAESRMSGFLNQQMNKHVQKLISAQIQKDIVHVNKKELLNLLKEKASFQY